MVWITERYGSFKQHAFCIFTKRVQECVCVCARPHIDETIWYLLCSVPLCPSTDFSNLIPPSPTAPTTDPSFVIWRIQKSLYFPTLVPAPTLHSRGTMETLNIPSIQQYLLAQGQTRWLQNSRPDPLSCLPCQKKCFRGINCFIVVTSAKSPLLPVSSFRGVVGRQGGSGAGQW